MLPLVLLVLAILGGHPLTRWRSLLSPCLHCLPHYLRLQGQECHCHRCFRHHLRHRHHLLLLLLLVMLLAWLLAQQLLPALLQQQELLRAVLLRCLLHLPAAHLLL
jgi:hypothetical protein